MEVKRIACELREACGPFRSEVAAFIDLAKIGLLVGPKGPIAILEHVTYVHLSFESEQESPDYKAVSARSFPTALSPRATRQASRLRRRASRATSSTKPFSRSCEQGVEAWQDRREYDEVTNKA